MDLTLGSGPEVAKPYNPLLTTLDIGGQEKKDYKSGFKTSVGAHIALAAALLIQSLVFPGSPPSYTPTLRVDMVDLPDALRQELKGAPKSASSQEIEKALKKAELDAKKIKSAPVKIEEAEPDEMVLKPKEKDKKEATQHLERDKKLKSALARIKSLDRINALEEDTPAPALIKGNKISKGTSLSGAAREAAQASYFDLIRDRLAENWALPVWLARQKFQAQVVIYLDGMGRLKGVRFTKSSGNAQFDEAVRKTVSDSQPFPRPPDALSSVVNNGIPTGFPL